MTYFKLNQINHGRIQLNQRDCDKPQIKSNDSW
jgi:hypothetical protein